MLKACDRDVKLVRSKGLVTRRGALFSLSVGATMLLYPRLGRAENLTGIDALDTASILVRSPADVLLVAVTRSNDRLVAVGEHGVIIYSDDDGKTWVQAQVPVNMTLTCVQFVTPNLGWAAGHFGVILITADRGETWQIQLNGVQANQLTLAAAQQAEAENSTLPGAALAVRRANAFVDGGADKPFLTLLALSSQKVIVFGAYRMAMLTTDGGKTWRDWSLHIYDRLSHNLYDAIKIGSNSYLVGEEGLVFRSTDGGDNYLQVTPTSDTTLFGIVAATEAMIIAFGVAGTGFRSTDGCKTWSPIALATQDDVVAGRILNTGNVLLLTESGGIFMSKDNGVTFQAVPDIAPRSAFDLEEAANGDLVIIGAAGVSIISSQRVNA